MSDRPSDPRALHEVVLQRAGIEPAAARNASSVRLYTGSYSEVHHVHGEGIDLVLKVYPTDIGGAVEAEPDSRFLTAARCFPVAPFFSATSERTEALRDAARSLGVEVPRVLAEGRLERGPHYTLMSRVPGVPWDPARFRDNDRQIALSSRMGRLLAALHAATREPNGEPGRVEALAEVLHMVADRIPPAAVGSERRRWSLHRRLARILERYAACDPAPSVLAHCDFHPSNLLFADDDSIQGLVDFQISCRGPAALDFRWLGVVDEGAFLDAYGLSPSERDEAHWRGLFFEMIWEGLAMATTVALTRASVGRDYWVAYASQFDTVIRLLENDRLRRHPGPRRRVLAGLIHARNHVRYAIRK